jgi:hypothetical protein
VRPIAAVVYLNQQESEHENASEVKLQAPLLLPSTRHYPEALDRREVQVPLWESQSKCEGSDTQEEGCAIE